MSLLPLELCHQSVAGLFQALSQRKKNMLRRWWAILPTRLSMFSGGNPAAHSPDRGVCSAADCCLSPAQQTDRGSTPPSYGGGRLAANEGSTAFFHQTAGLSAAGYTANCSVK